MLGERFKLATVAIVFIGGGLLIFFWGSNPPEWLSPGSEVVCSQTTLAITDPGHQFFDPLAIAVDAKDHLWIVGGENWRTRTNIVPPDYYVLVRNEAGVVLGYVPENYLIPTDQG